MEKIPTNLVDGFQKNEIEQQLAGKHQALRQVEIAAHALGVHQELVD